MKRSSLLTLPHHNIVVGYLLFAMIVSIIVREFIPSFEKPLLYLAIFSGWTGAILVAGNTRLLQRWIIGVMVVVGLALLTLVQQRTGSAAWLEAASQSLPLLTMILSVGFMKRIALRAFATQSSFPTGFKAFRDTVFTVATFGAFINISALIIVSDRLYSQAALNKHQVAAVTRAFSTCVCWSPFFAGLAVVISFSPAFSITTVVLQGVPLALMGVGLTLAWAWFKRDELTHVAGFPAKWSSLWIPTVLGIVVMTFRYLFGSIPLLPLIALAAFVVVIAVLLITDGFSGTVKTFHAHISEDLPRSANELTLLLGVGVLAVGMVSWVNLGDLNWRPPPFTGFTAAALLASMIVIAMLGIHPVVTIALASALLLPVNPNPELLATTMLLGWSLGTLACPLSGTHLTMQGRYALSAWTSATGQWPYVAGMFVLGSGWLLILAAWHQV